MTQFLIEAQIRMMHTNMMYQPITYPSTCNDEKQLLSQLEQQGYEVLSIKVQPFPASGVLVVAEEVTDGDEDALPNEDCIDTPTYAEIMRNGRHDT